MAIYEGYFVCHDCSGERDRGKRIRRDGKLVIVCFVCYYRYKGKENREIAKIRNIPVSIESEYKKKARSLNIT
jgi:hypothetical protein